MLFNSIHFLLFFPAVVLFYFLLPHKVRWIWLLIASYYFYMAWNAVYVLLMTASIAVTYLGGRLIDWSSQQEDQKKREFQRKLWVGLSVILNLLILFFFKYFHFAINILNHAFAVVGVQALRPSFDVLLPVGISFYTFKALGYTVDVYRGHVHAEKNVLKYALFVSFFPQLLAGPIERAKDLLSQIDERHTFNANNAKNGLLLMLWGFFQKMVIADRVAILANQVFDHHLEYAGFQVSVGVLFFAVQIYCDFSAYTDIARGAAQVMGFRLADNFRQPYFATSIRDFWKRWHITLGSWFRDYVFFPLSSSLVKKKWGLRATYWVSSLAVWFLTGLWHGASVGFVVWGLLHGLYQITGDITAPMRDRLYAKLQFRTEAFSFRLGKVCMTFLLTNLAWVFFRAPSVMTALRMIKRVFTTFNPWVLMDGSLYELGLVRQDFLLSLLAIGILFAINICRYRGMDLRGRLLAQGLAFRWIVYLAGIFSVIIFGVYGAAYDAGAFIYFQF